VTEPGLYSAPLLLSTSRWADVTGGCDGVTYNNACEAAKASVNISHLGPCVLNACCLPDGTCAELPPDSCLASGGEPVPGVGCDPGLCQPMTGACCDPLSPLSGCLGEGVTAADCATMGGSFVPGGACADSCGCLSVDPPAPVRIALPGNPVAVANRFVSVIPGNANRSIALRVTLDDLPVPFDVFNGRSLWVQEPVDICENSGQVTVPPGGCGPAPGTDHPTFPAATLGCDPVYRTWGSSDEVHIFHELIVPGGTYRVEAIVQGCDVTEPGLYSAPLLLSTSRWADVTGGCDVKPCPLPDGSVDITRDALDVLDKFRNRARGPLKWRADIAPATPNLLVDIEDVMWILTEFRSVGYPFSPPPFPCPDGP
ncbi:MAG: hypothetical protein D6788_04600, partial [Planctomycetota bacterium]